MDYNEVLSYKNISSRNVLSQIHEAHGAGNSIKPSKFVNHGLLLWNQGRRKWIGDKKALGRSRKLHMPKLRTLCLCMAKKFCCSGIATYDKLLRRNEAFPRPIPLRVCLFPFL
ncbi:hypothetical protein DH2020_016494 [Rehmannia glutinosa]|uniref:Gag1-like clamp domain-containing protein n=1 Tax=Rehmannia glutinosa TaxID=99300 RepID=A0ABR0WS01_REHGL